MIGKPPSNEFFMQTEEISLVKWKRKIMTLENPIEAIDPKLYGNGYEDQIYRFITIGVVINLRHI